MPTSRNDDMMVFCSFCGKNQDEVQKIIAGNNAFICNECVELAQEIIREELAEEDIFHIFTDITSFSQSSCVRNGKRHIETASKSLRQEGLT